MPKMEEKIAVVVDTREKNPWFVVGDRYFDVVPRALKTGDYTIIGMENVFVIERKGALNELLINFTSGRKRFYAEMNRMKEYPLRFLIIESTWNELLNPFSYKCRARKDRNESDMVAKKRAVAIVSNSLMDLQINFGIHVIMGGVNTKRIVKKLIGRVHKYFQEGRFHA